MDQHSHLDLNPVVVAPPWVTRTGSPPRLAQRHFTIGYGIHELTCCALLTISAQVVMPALQCQLGQFLWGIHSHPDSEDPPSCSCSVVLDCHNHGVVHLV